MIHWSFEAAEGEECTLRLVDPDSRTVVRLTFKSLLYLMDTLDHILYHAIKLEAEQDAEKDGLSVYKKAFGEVSGN